MVGPVSKPEHKPRKRIKSSANARHTHSRVPCRAAADVIIIIHLFPQQAFSATLRFLNTYARATASTVHRERDLRLSSRRLWPKGKYARGNHYVRALTRETVSQVTPRAWVSEFPRLCYTHRTGKHCHLVVFVGHRLCPLWCQDTAVRQVSFLPTWPTAGCRGPESAYLFALLFRTTQIHSCLKQLQSKWKYMHSLYSIAQKYFAFNNELNFQTKEKHLFFFLHHQRGMSTYSFCCKGGFSQCDFLRLDSSQLPCSHRQMDMTTK